MQRKSAIIKDTWAIGYYGGETGIRTLGTREGSTVFETAPFDHSGTSPRGSTREAFNDEFEGVQVAFCLSGTEIPIFIADRHETRKF